MISVPPPFPGATLTGSETAASFSPTISVHRPARVVGAGPASFRMWALARRAALEMGGAGRAAGRARTSCRRARAA